MTTPEGILAQINHPSGWDGWIPTRRPGGFRPFEPKVEEVRSEDIIFGLAGTWRFGGNTHPRMTVAEHVVFVSYIIEELWGRRYAAAGLLHDACETYTHDLQSPLRRFVTLTMPDGEVISWNELDRRVSLVIFDRYGIDRQWLDHPQVKAADILSAVFEKRDSKSLSQTDDWGLPEIPPEIAHWKLNYYSPEEAETFLRARWAELGLPR